MLLRSVFLGAFGGISFVTASPILQKRDFPDPEACLGNCSWIHDPNIYVQGNTYYRFSTSGNIPIATAPSLAGPWEYKGALLDKGTKIVVDQSKQDVWAPNVAKMGDTFYCYYSVSFMGSQDSQIGVATSKSLDPGSWTDHGSINMPKSPDYNLIDPAIFQENSNAPIYLTWGSYWNGIYQVELAESSITQFGYNPASNQNNLVRNSTVGADVVEGATLFAWQGKYYVFFSAGNCCATPPNLAPKGHEYRIMVCRSDSVNGPFLDKDGKNCGTQSGGTLVLGSHGDVYSPGGQGVMYDDKTKKVALYYHYVRPSVGYSADKFLFGYNWLDFQDGWPVVTTA